MIPLELGYNDHDYNELMVIRNRLPWSYIVLYKICKWWFDFKLKPIFTTTPAVSKNEARFKSGQNRLKIIGWLTMIHINETHCRRYNNVKELKKKLSTLFIKLNFFYRIGSWCVFTLPILRNISFLLIMRQKSIIQFFKAQHETVFCYIEKSHWINWTKSSEFQHARNPFEKFLARYRKSRP